MSVEEYDSYVAALNQLEAEDGGIRKGSPESLKSRLRSTYDELVTRWPWLEGFWVRWAETEFKLGSVDRATAVYRRALAKQALPHSVIVWVAYLGFLTHVCHIGPELPSSVHELFAEAESSIGSHFLSHEFWDLYLEWVPEPITILLHILDDLTLHQYARFYARLIELLHSPAVPLSDFSSVVPNEIVEPSSPEEEQRLREVIQSRLKLKYELQARRVDAMFANERNLRRPFFHPQSLPQGELDAWIQYIDSSADPVPLYRRALIPAALDAGLWLKYVRYLIATEAPQETTLSALEGAAGTKIAGLILYFALWLELKGHIDRARRLYETLLSRQDAGAEAIAQFSQFLARQGEAEQAKAELLKGFQRFPSVAVVQELAKYGDEAYSELDWSNDTDNAELWRARLAAHPHKADEIFESAPENSVTAEYLALLARSDAAKFLEVDRMVNRSALNT